MQILFERIKFYGKVNKCKVVEFKDKEQTQNRFTLNIESTTDLSRYEQYIANVPQSKAGKMINNANVKFDDVDFVCHKKALEPKHLLQIDNGNNNNNGGLEMIILSKSGIRKDQKLILYAADDHATTWTLWVDPSVSKDYDNMIFKLSNTYKIQNAKMSSINNNITINANSNIITGKQITTKPLADALQLINIDTITPEFEDEYIDTAVYVLSGNYSLGTNSLFIFFC